MTPFALLAVVAALAGGQPQVVHADGRIGQFRIDVTTKAELVAALGKPRMTTVAKSMTSRKRVGLRLVYSCGASCDTVYAFNDKTGKLSDFASTSRSFRTEHGAGAGMTAARAAKLERKPIVPGCSPGKAIRVRWDENHQLVLAVVERRVTLVAYIGPHTTYDDPFC